jgi:predicted GNAT family acetyltransferase
MSEILQDFTPAALVAAIEVTLFDLMADFGRLPQAVLHDDSAIRWVMTGGPHPSLNQVIRTQWAAAEIDASIEATLVPFKARQVPMSWWTTPTTRPADLGKHLEAHGLAHVGDWTGMAVDLLAMNEDLPAPVDLIIEPVGDERTMKEWSDTLTIGYQVPDFVGHAFAAVYSGLGFGEQQPWRFYLARLNREAVAVSAMFLTSQVAHIAHVATVPAARGQGIGAAVTLAPLCEARRRGYRISVLQSSPMGVGVYRRIGFQEYCKMGLYFWPGTALWQRLTERARRVIDFAREEAARLGEIYIGTEHLLLGLTRVPDGVGAKILVRLGISLESVENETRQQVTRGTANMGQAMQLTPRAEKVIDLAYAEAGLLNNNYIGAEHLLLGLIREGEGLAAKLLVKLGADLERVRREVHAMQAGP